MKIHREFRMLGAKKGAIELYSSSRETCLSRKTKVYFIDERKIHNLSLAVRERASARGEYARSRQRSSEEIQVRRKTWTISLQMAAIVHGWIDQFENWTDSDTSKKNIVYLAFPLNTFSLSLICEFCVQYVDLWRDKNATEQSTLVQWCNT